MSSPLVQQVKDALAAGEINMARDVLADIILSAADDSADESASVPVVLCAAFAMHTAVQGEYLKRLREIVDELKSLLALERDIKHEQRITQLLGEIEELKH